MKRTITNSFLLSMALGLTLVAGCHKKDRLTGNTFTLTVDPPAAQVVKGQTQTLVLKTSSQGVNPQTSAEWTVSNTNGSINTTFGPSVVFSADALGDVEVTAVAEGQQVSAQIAVVSFIPGGSTFDVYSDNGLPSGTGILSDIVTGLLTINEISTGYTPEGTKYQRSTAFSGGGTDFWGVTLDKNTAGLSKNLSSFTGGNVKFNLRLGRVLDGGDSIQVTIEDTTASRGPVTLGAAQGLSTTSTDWQEISIPLSSFTGLDLTAVKVPFLIRTPTLSSNLKFDVDAVRWEN